ncbi:hypothetical protein Ahy_B09g098139 [Arachis hypogaea]|uniref:Transmembrane protein n=1 Tax=Arachis hypogaea TaxID=3818 RepID=A0A444XQL8_ARAHY|nr:hypothetical protein Ahy_B09g098139 [Arachis hypogaea]
MIVFDDENQVQENSFIYMSIFKKLILNQMVQSGTRLLFMTSILGLLVIVILDHYLPKRFIANLIRDTIQAVTNFAKRNKLPILMQKQMIAHLHMKYRTDIEGQQQQEFKYIFIFHLNTLLDINIV